ncbi:MAG: hypothetical protein NC039_05585 [Muribaculaceae bacterium]|nr:hypothetical protein [Muribaculaceae bacterium]
MKKKFLYILTALLAVTATSCKDDDITNPSPADLERMPRTMFCTQESTGDDNETNVHCVTEELNTIYLSWFKVKDAIGYQLRYAISTGVTSGLPEDWDNNRAREIYIGENVKQVVPAEILNSPKTQIFESIRDKEEYTDFKSIRDDAEYIIVCEDLNIFKLYNLEYSTDYRFAIKTLSPKGSEYDSEWYGYGDGRHWAEYCGQGTMERYAYPSLLSPVSKDKTSITLSINLNVADATNGVSAVDVESYKENFEWNSDSTMFIADMIRITPDVMTPNAAIDEKWKNGVSLESLNVQDGIAQFTVDGLDQNTVYIVNLINSNIPVAVDSYYNTVSIRTSGDPGEPILIKHTWEGDTNLVAHEYQACRIDTILSHFMDDNSVSEGQVFQLEGGKLYYMASSLSMYKGFTLETRPEDVAEGKRATVYMGGLKSSKGNKDINVVGQLVLGRSKRDGESDAPIIIESIKFNNLDIKANGAVNYGGSLEGGSLSGNYFCNMLSNGMGVTFDSFEVHNCTFQGLIRGFMRTQGSKVKIFKKIVIDNCVFYNCGYYAANGNSYSMFASDGKSPKCNFYTDFNFTNNTMYDSPYVNIINDNNANLAWPEDIKYNINFSNNTLINWNTRASGRYVFAMRYLPSGSKITFKNNLICLAADDRDIRNLNNNWGDIRQINGTTDGIPQLTLDVENNYSTGCRDEHLKDDGIWTAQAPSANKNSLGALWTATPGLLQSGADHSLGADALITRVGKVALLTTELFANPNPPYFAHDPAVSTSKDHIAPDDIWSALRISPSGRCPADHEILVKQIGAPRWYSADPKNYRPE